MSENTAPPSFDQYMARVVKAVRLLHQAGFTNEDWQRIIDDPLVREEIVRAAKPKEYKYDLPLFTTERALNTLIQHLWPDNYTEFALQRATYLHWEDVAELMRLVLTPREQHLLSLRFGIEGDAMTLEQVGQKLGISSSRVQRLEVRSLRRVREKGLALLQVSLDNVDIALIGLLPLSSHTETVLRSRGIKTVSELMSLTANEILMIRWSSNEMLEEVRNALYIKGLHLKDDTY